MPRSTAASLGVIGTTQLTVALVNQLVIIILAHYLTPEDFGIFAICHVVINLALAVSSFGLEEAAIQTKKDPERSIVTAATLRLILAFGAAAVLLVSAPYITRYFGIEDATLALQVLCVSFVLLGLAFIPRVWLKRELKFRLIALSSIVNMTLWSVTALALGLAGAGYWALILAFLVGTIGSSATVWALRPSKVQFVVERTPANHLLRFGAYVMFTNLIVFLFMNLDKVAIGRMLGFDLLGVYWMAFQYGTQPTFFMTTVMVAVIFPTYVSISHNIELLRDKHRKVLKYLALVSFPIGIGLASVSPSFVISLLGPEWSGAVAPLSILCIFGVMYSITSTSGAVFISTDNARQMFKQNIVMFVPFILLLLPMTYFFGLTGIAFLFTVIIFVQLVWVTLSVGRILSLPLVDELRNVYLVPFVASAFMALVLVLLWLVMGTSLLTLVTQVAVGCLVYLVVVYAATRGTIVSEARGLIRSVLKGGTD